MYSCPSITMRNWLQDPSTDIQVPYIKWHRIMHHQLSTSVDSQPQVENFVYDLQLVESVDVKPYVTILKDLKWGGGRIIAIFFGKNV